MEVAFEFFRGDTYERNFVIQWSKEITEIFFTLKT